MARYLIWTKVERTVFTFFSRNLWFSHFLLSIFMNSYTYSTYTFNINLTYFCSHSIHIFPYYLLCFYFTWQILFWQALLHLLFLRQLWMQIISSTYKQPTKSSHQWTRDSSSWNLGKQSLLSVRCLGCQCHLISTFQTFHILVFNYNSPKWLIDQIFHQKEKTEGEKNESKSISRHH